MSSNYTYSIAPVDVDDYIRILAANMVQEKINSRSKASALVAKFRGDDRTSPNLTCNVYLTQAKSKAVLYSTDIHTILAILEGNNPYHLDYPVVQLDDTGWGSPIGGTIIGALGPGGYFTELIPIEEHVDVKTSPGFYQKVADISAKLIKQAVGAVDRFVVEICPSHVFSETRGCLKEQGLTFRTAQIRGNLQQRLRSEFLAYLGSQGVPHDVADKSYEVAHSWATKHGRSDLIKWRQS